MLHPKGPLPHFDGSGIFLGKTSREPSLFVAGSGVTRAEENNKVSDGFLVSVDVALAD